MRREKRSSSLLSTHEWQSPHPESQHAVDQHNIPEALGPGHRLLLSRDYSPRIDRGVSKHENNLGREPHAREIATNTGAKVHEGREGALN